MCNHCKGDPKIKVKMDEWTKNRLVLLEYLKKKKEDKNVNNSRKRG